uniref:NopRA1 domain-containing protein n=1 Tax=Globodera pallida TaxID=36090 RepID=A0A183BZ00_GLOPA
MQFLSIKVESEETARKFICSLCYSTDVLSDEPFVDSLIAELSVPAATSEFVSFITKSTNKSALKALCGRLSLMIDRNLDPIAELDWRVGLLISLLASIPTLRLSTDESRKWIAFLAKPTFVDNISLKTSLATILACPHLMPDQTSFKIDDHMERSLVGFFKHIHSLIQSSEYSSLSNMMILIYVHLITDNGADLAALLSSVLGRKVPKTLHKQSLVKSLYIAHALLEQDVAQKAASISITRDLCAHSSGYLPVHCIAHLLNWQSFSKYGTPIEQWIKAQLKECRVPVHPIISTLLENFTSSCIPTDENVHFNKSIDESFFEEIFCGDMFDESRLPMRLIALTYLIAFTYKLDTQQQRDPHQITCTQSHRSAPPKAYSQQLWKSIPIRYLLIVADQRYNDFQHIRPMLLRYVVLSMPHLLPEQDHFDAFRSAHQKDGVVSRHRTPFFPIDEFAQVLEEASACHNFCRLSKALSVLLERATVEQQFRYYELILRAMVLSLDGGWPRALVDKLQLAWERFDSVIPRRLHEDTIRLWLSSAHAAQVGRLDQRDNAFLVAHTPLVLFRVDSRIFRSPSHLRCFCRSLTFYLAASRDVNTLQLARSSLNSSKGETEEKEALLRSFGGTQRLAVVQTFIELCDCADSDDLEEIRQILSSQIHQLFIADTHLPKLVHFNMYPLRLIPVIVRRVPSAHVLINSISELITGGNLERRIFAVVLITELLELYKIPSAFSALSLISDMLDAMMVSIVTDEFIVLMLNVVPSLARLILLSPFHAEHFLAILERTRKLAFSRMAVYSSLSQARTSPEQRLFELISRTTEDLPKLP